MINAIELEQIRGAIEAHKQGHDLPCVANAPYWLEIMLDEIERLRAGLAQYHERTRGWCSYCLYRDVSVGMPPCLECDTQSDWRPIYGGEETNDQK